MKYLCILVLAAAAAANAGTIALNNPVVEGNQQFDGSLGMDFNVNVAIDVTALGAFDSAADGLNLPITVSIYDRTNTTSPLVTIVFSVGTSATLIGGSRFIDLATPLYLPAGFEGSIVASGYGAGEPNGNTNDSNGFSTIDTGGGAISFVGTGRYGNAGSFPATADAGAVNKYGAGTFEFLLDSGTTAVPEPGSAALMTAGFLFFASWSARRLLNRFHS